MHEMNMCKRGSGTREPSLLREPREKTHRTIHYSLSNSIHLIIGDFSLRFTQNKKPFLSHPKLEALSCGEFVKPAYID